jgi:predicted Zn-dependent peptidase
MNNDEKILAQSCVSHFIEHICFEAADPLPDGVIKNAAMEVADALIAAFAKINAAN